MRFFVKRLSRYALTVYAFTKTIRMTYKVETRDQKILHMALLNANATAESIGGPIGEQGYQVRRALSGMQKEGIISPYTLINQFALGWMKIGVFFSFLPVEGQNIPEIIQKLQDYPNIVSAIELFGPYQYFMSVNAKSVPDFEEFMATLYDDIPDLKIDEAVSIRRRLSLFKRKYLAPDLGNKTHLTYSYTGNAEKLDDLSISVLNYMITAGGLPNGPAIAEAVGVSNTTVHNKIADLEKRGVIVGYSYSIDPYKIGYSSFDLLIKTSSRSTSLKDTFFGYCASHENVVGLTECTGAWQYEVRIEVPSITDATRISQEMLRDFSHSIHKIDIVNVNKELKYMRTPLIETGSPENPSPQKKNVA